MAETKNVTYDSLMRDLAEGKYAPIYYLMGDEAYYIDKISDYIAEHAFSPTAKLNYNGLLSERNDLSFSR